MEIIKEPTNVQIQLALTNESRKNLYAVAKWFSLAGFVLMTLMFLIFTCVWADLASKIKNWDIKAESAQRSYTILISYSLINCLFSLGFWLYLRRIVRDVGTAEEVAHTGFGVCDLIFVNLIAGILILVASSSFKRSQVLKTLAEQQMQDMI